MKLYTSFAVFIVLCYDCRGDLSDGASFDAFIVKSKLKAYNRSLAAQTFYETHQKIFLTGLLANLKDFDEVYRTATIILDQTRVWKDASTPFLSRRDIPVGRRYIRLWSNPLWSPDQQFDKSLMQCRQMLGAAQMVRESCFMVLKVPCEHSGYKRHRDQYKCEIKGQKAPHNIRIVCLSSLHAMIMNSEHRSSYTKSAKCSSLIDIDAYRMNISSPQNPWQKFSQDVTKVKNRIRVNLIIQREQPSLTIDIAVGMAIALMAICQPLLRLENRQRFFVGAMGLITASDYVITANRLPLVLYGRKLQIGDLSFVLLVLHCVAVVWTTIVWNISQIAEGPLNILPRRFLAKIDCLLIPKRQVYAPMDENMERVGRDNLFGGTNEWDQLIRLADCAIFLLLSCIFICTFIGILM